LGLCQLKALPHFITRRQAIAAQYTAALRGLNAEPPAVAHGRDHLYYRYVVRLPYPVDPALKAFAARGVMCRRPVFRPLHRYLGLTGFPETDRVWEHALSVPIYPSLTDAEIARVVGAMRAVLA